MADISMQSERFIALYEQIEPLLQSLARTGPLRAIRLELPAYFPGQVLEKLEPVRKLAEQAIQLAGPSQSHVVLTGYELSMLRWGLQQE